MSRGVVLTEPSPVGPWPGFALAAEAAVQRLHRLFGMDLWLATHVRDGEQVVVASAGPLSVDASVTSVVLVGVVLALVRGVVQLVVAYLPASMSARATAVPRRRCPCPWWCR